MQLDKTRETCYNKYMLVRREFDPFSIGASADDVMSAHCLLSDARGSKPKTTIDAALADLELFRDFTHGSVQRPGGIMLYDSPEATVGLAYITEFPRSSTLSLDALAVAVAHRGNGLGAEILDDVIDHSFARGLGRVSLSVDYGNKKAQRLYESRFFVVDEDRDSHLYMVRRNS